MPVRARISSPLLQRALAHSHSDRSGCGDERRISIRDESSDRRMASVVSFSLPAPSAFSPSHAAHLNTHVGWIVEVVGSRLMRNGEGRREKGKGKGKKTRIAGIGTDCRPKRPVQSRCCELAVSLRNEDISACHGAHILLYRCSCALTSHWSPVSLTAIVIRAGIRGPSLVGPNPNGGESFPFSLSSAP